MKNFILISPNITLANRIKLLCENSNDFCLLNHFFEQKSAKFWLSENDVDFLILDMFLFDADSLSFAQKIKLEFPKLRVILVTDFMSKELGDYAKQIGIENIISTNVSLEILQKIFAQHDSKTNVSLDEKNKGEETFNKDKILDEKISRICLNVGISPKNLGYQYFKEAIKIVAQNPKIMGRITKELYPAIASKFSANVASVERALRHALDFASSTENFKNLNQILGCEIITKNRRLSSGEFIALVADKITLDFL